MARSNPPLTQLVRRRARAPPAGPERGAGAAADLDRAAAGRSRARRIEQLVQAESQQQAADQVSISNSIGSLRFLGAMDWREFVETHERRRADAARGSGRRLRARWISPRATATATWSSGSRSRSALAESEVARRRSSWRRRVRRRRRATTMRPTSATTWSTTGAASSSEALKLRGVTAQRAHDRSARLPLLAYTGPDRGDRRVVHLGHAAGQHRQRRWHRAGSWLARRSCASSPPASSASRWSTGSRRCWRAATRCRAWTSPTASRPRCAHAGGGADDAGSIAGASTSWSKRWKSASSPTATTHLHFALLTDFRDAAAEIAAGRTQALLDAAQREHRSAQRDAIAGERRRPLLPVPPPAPLERARAGAGWATSASAASSRELNALLRGARRASASRCIVGDTARAGRRALRDHARHRHPAAARRRARSSSARWRIR